MLCLNLNSCVAWSDSLWEKFFSYVFNVSHCLNISYKKGFVVRFEIRGKQEQIRLIQSRWRTILSYVKQKKKWIFLRSFVSMQSLFFKRYERAREMLFWLQLASHFFSCFLCLKYHWANYPTSSLDLRWNLSQCNTSRFSHGKVQWFINLRSYIFLRSIFLLWDIDKSWRMDPWHFSHFSQCRALIFIDVQFITL